MKIRYYIKGIKNKDLILNEKRGGYLFIEHHKINRFKKINSIDNVSENVLFDFEFNKTSKASGIFKKSKVTHEIKILDKQEYIPEIIYLKPNIIQKYRLYLNNRETTDWLKEQLKIYSKRIIIGIIALFFTLLGFYIKKRMNTPVNDNESKTSPIVDKNDLSSLKTIDFISVKNDTIKNKNNGL